MRGIGDPARASGLSVSALRFYDSAGVLVPAMVDPDNGYRWYTDEQVRHARLVAGLRRVGMPVAEIAEVLRRLPDAAAARTLVAAHLRRLEDGLADARRELSRVNALLDSEEKPMSIRFTVSGAQLAAAVDAIRFAVGRDPEMPMLRGVLVDVAADAVTLVATDRYRMAVYGLPSAEVHGPPADPPDEAAPHETAPRRAIVPESFVDEVRSALGDGPVAVELSAGAVVASGSGWRIETPPLGYEFPDYRRLIEAHTGAGAKAAVDVAALRETLAHAPRVVREHDGVTHDLAVLTVDAGAVRVAAEGDWVSGRDTHVAVNREFLLEALAAAGTGQLYLELDGPIRPLAIRRDGADGCSILMPVAP